MQDDERFKHYKPDELPATLTRKLYVCYGIGGYCAGQISIRDFNYEEKDSVVLCESECSVTLPQNLDIKGLAIKALEDEKQKVLAENHKRLKTVQDKIDNLLAIEYRPGEATPATLEAAGEAGAGLVD